MKEHVFEGEVVSGKFTPEFAGCIGKLFSVKKLPLGIAKICRMRIRDAVKHEGDKTLNKNAMRVI